MNDTRIFDDAEPTPSTIPVNVEEIPIVCTLAASDIDARLEEWRSMLAKVIRRDAIDSGIRLVFPKTEGLAGVLADIAEREQACCSWTEFAVNIRRDELTLDVTAPQHAQEIVATFYGEKA